MELEVRRKTAVLRPIDFLLPFANLRIVPLPEDGAEENDGIYLPTISTKQQASEYFRGNMNRLAKLWKIWYENYILELRNFHQKRIKQKKLHKKVSKSRRSSPPDGRYTPKGGMATRTYH
ncbi:unnamed protein product [Nippostrongylus brasiliensis]|uniref:DUF5641 domain-containing protein n=1 Tax=Nippostrongylus brasiliensis TaxID=27835 RepID=A0A0N4XF96_NIPBR|nr:unnamed protein product [Nippostrongylus brasiliensis]